MIPRLETDRLVLRGFAEADLDAFAAMLADPEVTRFIAQAPLTREQAWRRMAATLGHWQLRGFGMWAVERKEDGAFLGRIGLMQPEGWPGLELGWSLARRAWGHGYATEAAAGAMDYGFLVLSPSRLISSIDADNLASQQVAARLGESRGAAQTIMADGHSFSAEIWSIEHAQWRRRRA